MQRRAERRGAGGVQQQAGHAEAPVQKRRSRQPRCLQFPDPRRNSSSSTANRCARRRSARCWRTRRRWRWRARHSCSGTSASAGKPLRAPKRQYSARRRPAPAAGPASRSAAMHGDAAVASRVRQPASGRKCRMSSSCSSGVAIGAMSFRVCCSARRAGPRRYPRAGCGGRTSDAARPRAATRPDPLALGRERTRQRAALDADAALVTRRAKPWNRRMASSTDTEGAGRRRRSPA